MACRQVLLAVELKSISYEADLLHPFVLNTVLNTTQTNRKRKKEIPLNKFLSTVHNNTNQLDSEELRFN